MHELIKTWRKNWLLSILYVASIKDQSQHWINPEQNNPYWSFVELMCTYFDDLSLNDGYESFVNQGFVTPEEVALVSDWHGKLDGYDPPNNDEYNHFAILNDPEWISICREARHVCKKLLSVLSNPDERELLYKFN